MQDILARPQHEASSRADAYQQVTDRIIAALEAGTVPWRRPWKKAAWPRSMSTGKRYAGVNVMLLASADQVSPFWGTYRQIQQLGGQVRRGERSELVTFWKELEIADADKSARTGKAETRRIPMLRIFRVFNAAQADGLPDKFMPVGNAVETDTAAESLIGAYLAS